MNLLITGSSGFIGSHLVKHFEAAGHIVIPFDLRGGAISRDIRDTQLVNRTVDLNRPDAILHLAALTGVTPSWDNPQAYVETNVMGSLNVLQAAATYRIPVILASSSSVYNAPYQYEDTPIDAARTPYGVSKATMEQLARLYWGQIPITILRLFNVFGPGGRKDMLPFLALHAAATGQPLILRGDTQWVSRDWTYIDDVAQAFDRALQKLDSYQVYNIGGGQPVTLNAFVETVNRVTGHFLSIGYAPALPGEAFVTRARNERAFWDLGWQPTIDLEEGLKRMYEWYQKEIK